MIDARVYLYRDAVNGFFEFPTEAARSILPRSRTWLVIDEIFMS